MIHAVIGAQFGDEGKGLIVDYLSDHLTLVVRFNGGAQAGHTVVVDDGRRHVFGHLGAGCYKAACTLLSRFFIVNPVLYAREFHEPNLEGIRRTTYVDERCMVTTPVDMMLNQLVEAKRGERRHGSCGLGINETVTRSGVDGGLVTVQDLYYGQRQDAARRVMDYGAWRANALGVELPGNLHEVFQRWWQDVDFLLSTTTTTRDDEMLRGTGDVVFEGAQGLRLDEHAPGFPHVTRSRTGLTNVLTLLNEAKRDEPLDVTYVTRAYVTRHGAGPLASECVGHPYGWTGAETNVENTHQGRLRYAPLSTDDLSESIVRDMGVLHKTQLRQVRPALAVTCLDQLSSSPARYSPEGVARSIARDVGLPLRFWSTGPTRNDVHREKENA